LLLSFNLILHAIRGFCYEALATKGLNLAQDIPYMMGNLFVFV